MLALLAKGIGFSHLSGHPLETQPAEAPVQGRLNVFSYLPTPNSEEPDLPLGVNMIQDMLCKFEAYLREIDASPASIKAYLCDLRKFIRWYEDTTGTTPKTAAIIRLDIVEFRNYLERSARQQPATINRALSSLSVYFTWAMGKKHILSNPVDGVNTIKAQLHAPKWLERHDLHAGPGGQRQEEAKQARPCHHCPSDSYRAQGIRGLPPRHRGSDLPRP